MDLGSAVLSAELALDLLDDPAVRDRVLLCPAPLVEGLVVAAVAAAGGASRQEVAAEAQGALLGQVRAPRAGRGRRCHETRRPGAGVQGAFTVENPHGLHARPAARLVGEVRRLDAVVTLRNATTGAGPVPAGSLSRVATLGALRGHVVEVTATGRRRRRHSTTCSPSPAAGSTRPTTPTRLRWRPRRAAGDAAARRPGHRASARRAG